MTECPLTSALKVRIRLLFATAPADDLFLLDDNWLLFRVLNCDFVYLDRLLILLVNMASCYLGPHLWEGRALISSEHFQLVDQEVHALDVSHSH